MVTGNKIRFLNIDILALTQNKLLHELNEGVFYTPNIDHFSMIGNFIIFIDKQIG